MYPHVYDEFITLTKIVVFACLSILTHPFVYFDTLKYLQFFSFLHRSWKMQEINNIIKIVGLQYKKSYDDAESLKTLRYGKIMIMTDQVG